MKIDRIVSLTVVGGFLDGTRVAFSRGLNCIIGARGTGKTTLLELIRYALDSLPKRDISPAARRRVEELVEGNLQGGRVELEVETRDGLRYIVTRSVGDDPIVLDPKRNPTSLTLDSNSFFRVDIFSQNEVETIADHGRFQLELIDSFEREEIADLNQQVANITLQVVAHAKQTEPLSAKLGNLNEQIKQLPLVEERLKAFHDEKDETGKKVDQAHAHKALRDREVRTFGTAGDVLEELTAEVSALKGRFKAELSGKFTKEMLDGPNGEIMTSVFNRLKVCAKAFGASVDEALKILADCDSDLETKEDELNKIHRKQELAFRALVEKHKKHQAQSAERAKLEKKRNQLMEFKAEAVEIRKRLRASQRKRASLLEELSETRDSRYHLRKSVADRLNAILAPNITVAIQQDGNPEDYFEFLERSLKRSGVKQGMVAQKLTRNLPPTQLAQLVRSADSALLTDRGDLNADQANNVIAALNSLAKLAELETVELQDEPSICLKVGALEKESATLSTGQKCTTILPILLLEGGNPLLIDQPEDNLDNRFISETVVDSIEKMKRKRQLIFVTHNPNIPVLGDASRVFVMESEGEHACTAASGSVDDCREHIVTLLEGGEDAFRRRGQRYGV